MMRTLMCWVVLALGFTSVASAGSLIDDCGTCDWGVVEAYGEALYLRPYTCSFNYAIEDPTFFQRNENEETNYYAVAPKGTQKDVCPNFDWGFRVGVGCAMCNGCWDGSINYSRLSSKHEQRCDIFEGTALWPTVGPVAVLDFNTGLEDRPVANVLTSTLDYPGFASDTLSIEWDAINGELGSRHVRGCDVWVRSFVGVHWTNIRLKEHVHYQGVDLQELLFTWEGDIHNRNCTWGVGPRVGFDARYDLGCGLGVGAHVGAALLGGEISRTDWADGERDYPTMYGELELHETICATTDVRSRSRCAIYPEMDAAIGVNFLLQCGCWFSLFAEAGWEFHHYWNVLDHAQFIDETTAATVATCEDFALQGAYIHLGAVF